MTDTVRKTPTEWLQAVHPGYVFTDPSQWKGRKYAFTDPVTRRYFSQCSGKMLIQRKWDLNPPRLSSEATFNINCQVFVHLTERGEEVLREVMQREHELMTIYVSPVTGKNTGASVEDMINWKRHEDGFRFQLYEFMHIFGPYLPDCATSDARYQLFEHNNIVLLPS